MTERWPYLDNIKVILICGVIALHVSITYGFEGSWYLESYDQMSDALIIAITIALGTGWLFGLGLFFLIAGRLSEPSLERKGPGAFARDRAVRLGVPLLVYMFTFSPLLEYVDERFEGEAPESVWNGFAARLLDFVPGPMWFLEALLVFSFGYAMVRALTRRRGAPRRSEMQARHVVIAVATIAVSSFAAHLAFPIGSEQFHLQLGMFPQYITMYSLGAYAGRRGWLESLTAQLQRGCGLAALVALVAFGLSLWIGDFFSGDAARDRFAGGIHWQAACVSLVEGVMAACVSLWVVGLFRRRYNHLNRLTTTMSPAAYGAYVVHPPIIVGLALAVQPLPVPAEVKWLSVLVCGIAASFGVVLVARSSKSAQRSQNADAG